MSDHTQAILALSRMEIMEFLLKVVGSLDDQTLKLAVHTLASSYRPQMLKDLVDTPLVKKASIL